MFIKHGSHGGTLTTPISVQKTTQQSNSNQIGPWNMLIITFSSKWKRTYEKTYYAGLCPHQQRWAGE